jgi:sterol desaturase/sphingolipid hydroxylase (fatty acid hydroxylase superfamily)
VPFIAVFALLFAERLRPRHEVPRGPAFRARIARNLGLGALYRLLVLPVALAPIMAAAKGVHLWTRPAVLSGWTTLAVDLLVLDLLQYALHVAAHKIPLLWRFHAVHHMDEHIDASTGFRTHFVEKAVNASARVAIVIALDIPLPHVITFEAISLWIGLFHHQNLGIPPRIDRALNALIITRSFHDIHHGRYVRYTDSNYGYIFSIWDYAFRTYSTNRRPPGFENGLDDHRDPSLDVLVLGPFLGKRGWAVAYSKPVPEQRAAGLS